MVVRKTGILGDSPDHDTISRSMRLTRDEVYYFQIITFQVGNTLFRVPKNVFNIPGTFFGAIFALPPMTETDCEGSSDDNPIVLNVNDNDFRGFLRIICGSRVEKVTDEDWLGALNLATLWTFDNVRREAILALDGWSRSQSLKQVIVTAKRYKIVTWLKVAYTQIVLNPYKALELDELTSPPAVDWETIAKLLHIMHQFAITDNYFRLCNRCGFGRICCGFVDDTVEETFKAEFEELSTEDSLPRGQQMLCGRDS